MAIVFIVIAILAASVNALDGWTWKCDNTQLLCCDNDKCDFPLRECGCLRNAPYCTPETEETPPPTTFSSKCHNLWTDTTNLLKTCPDLEAVNHFFDYLEYNYLSGCDEPVKDLEKYREEIAAACRDDSCAQQFTKLAHEFVQGGCVEEAIVEEKEELASEGVSEADVYQWELEVLGKYYKFISGLNVMCKPDHTSTNTCAEQLGKAKLNLLSQPGGEMLPTPESCKAAAEAVCCDADLVTTGTELAIGGNMLEEEDTQVGAETRKDILKWMDNACKDYSQHFHKALETCPTIVNMLIEAPEADITTTESEAAEGRQLR
eukprot:Filipodium_phascolosomae@DN2357_c0_g2_i1.p1